MTEEIDGSLEKTGEPVNEFITQDTEQLDCPDLDDQRRAFIQRNRVYLKPAITNKELCIVNKPGPLSCKDLWVIVEKRPFDFLGNARCYESNPLYDQFLEKAARNSIKEGSITHWTILKHAYLFDGQPWSEEVVMAAVEKTSHSLVVQFAERIKDKKLRKKVLARAKKLLKLKKSAK